MQATQTIGYPSFTAGEDLLAYRRVKIKAGTVTIPPEVEYADAGEAFIGITQDDRDLGEIISVRPLNDSGTFIVTASKGIALGATVYGAIDGKVSDAANGVGQFIAKTAASNAGDYIEAVISPYVSTTAATVSIADAGGFTATGTVEAALAEIYQHLKSIQGFISVPLTSFRELAAGVFINAAGNGGVLATDTTPILSNIADGDGMRIAWAAGNADQIEAQVILPPDIDLTANLVVHMLCSKDANNNNTVHMDGEAYFGESDTDCFPAAAAANLLVQAKGEYTATILAADLPANQTNANMTLVLMPEAHAGDAVYLHGVWIEYKKTVLAS